MAQLTLDEFAVRWKKLSEDQQAVVRARSKKEHRTFWAMMNTHWYDKDPVVSGVDDLPGTLDPLC